MGNTYTLIYLFNNFGEHDEFILNDINEFDPDEFKDIFKFIEKNIKKVPDRIVDNILAFAKSYS